VNSWAKTQPKEGRQGFTFPSSREGYEALLQGGEGPLGGIPLNGLFANLLILEPPNEVRRTPDRHSELGWFRNGSHISSPYSFVVVGGEKQGTAGHLFNLQHKTAWPKKKRVVLGIGKISRDRARRFCHVWNCRGGGGERRGCSRKATHGKECGT